MYVIFYHINLFNYMQDCGLTTRIKVTFNLIRLRSLLAANRRHQMLLL